MTVIKSRFPDVALTNKTVTQRVFEGIVPERTVLVDGPTGREMTGAQFIAAVKSLAGGLTQRGFAPNRVLALMAPNIPEYCVVFHGAAWAGDTITTVNPTYTVHEVQHQLIDWGLKSWWWWPPSSTPRARRSKGPGCRKSSSSARPRARPC